VICQEGTLLPFPDWNSGGFSPTHHIGGADPARKGYYQIGLSLGQQLLKKKATLSPGAALLLYICPPGEEVNQRYLNLPRERSPLRVRWDAGLDPERRFLYTFICGLRFPRAPANGKNREYQHMFFITSSYFVMAVMVAILASSRGRSGLGWFCLAFLASPIGAGLLLLTRPNLKAEEAARREIAESKVCPRCAETVKNAAAVCRFCGHEFGMSQESWASNQTESTATAESPYIEDISLPF
jgi:hypothetical protein